jgi:hypothetical protein
MLASGKISLYDRLAGRMQRAARTLSFEFYRRVSAPRYGNTLSLGLNRSYKRYLAHCRRRYAEGGNPPAPAESVIRERGVEICPGILPRAEADALSAELSAALDRNAEGIERATTWQGRHITFEKPLSVLGERFFGIINADVEQRLRAYFHSHFKVQVVHAVRVHPIPAAQGSFLWHIDDMPQEAVSLFVYLTDTDDDGGGTAFLDRGETAALQRAGYFGHRTKERIDDIAAFGAGLGIACKPFRPKLARGDGILWQNNVLHRGILPRRGFRDLLSIMFLPSPRPWREEAAREGFAAIQARARGESKKRWHDWLQQLNRDA